MENYVRDTIVALSSPRGVGAIAVIRISGSKALEFLEKTVKFKNIPTERKLYFGNFFDDNGEIVDEIMYAYFRAPRSYTGEDVVEIYSHGGVLVTKKILETYIKLGARLAENGEFTRRAFLTGKMDLIKAESVLQIIEAKSETSLKLALENLKGKLSSEINFLRSSLLDVLSKIEVSIDYGDDIEVDASEILNDLVELKEFLGEKLKNADKKLHLTSGVMLAIVGKPNVGKSTLLNLLLMEDRAIVTDIPGTTRDVIKGEIKIGGVHFVISDTAGIRETNDKV
ncbi:MAG: tRNA uridine-5-carboxymethylaminomethyl(34) synthesis GTPase MnmE, partial [Fervidobacterium sp.]